MDEINKLASLEGAEINKAKKILAFEITSLVHGKEEAKKAEEEKAAILAAVEASGKSLDEILELLK